MDEVVKFLSESLKAVVNPVSNQKYVAKVRFVEYVQEVACGLSIFTDTLFWLIDIINRI